MPGGPPRFFADESVMGLGRVLALARRDVLYPGHRDIPEVRPGTLDSDWMAVVATRGLVVFDRDRHIRTRPVEREAFRTHGLRVFWLAGKRDLSTWDSLRLLVQHWDRIEELVRDRGPGPWFQAVSGAGIRELPV